MSDYFGACRVLGDRDLIASLLRLRMQENTNLADIIAHLAEVDRRRLYAEESFPSLFVFCTGRLRYSEAEAAWRIYTARAAMKFPAVLSFIEPGGLPMTSIVTLAPHLTEENHVALLERAREKSKLELQRIIAELAPKSDTNDVIRRLPESIVSPKPPQDMALPIPDAAPVFSASPARKDLVEPTAPERVRFAFNGGDELLNLLRRAQEILKHKYPAGNLECIFREALEALLDKKDPDRRIRAKEEKGKVVPVDPAPSEDGRESLSRRIPQAVRDAVWRRDEGQCVFVDPGGVRCPERGGLEFDHIVPFALGGASNNPKNLRLLCKAHNLLMARRAFGDGVTRYWRS